MIHSKEINACFRNHLISSSFIISGCPFWMLFALPILCPFLPLKMRLIMAISSRSFFAEILYNSNSNSNSYTSNNSNSKVDTIRITHNNMCIGNSNSNRLNEIVRTSSNPSINAKCV